MKNERYDRDYFIRFFEAIPGDKWICGCLHAGDRSCAVGHVLSHNQTHILNGTGNFDPGSSPILDALRKLTREATCGRGIEAVNDGYFSTHAYLLHPKDRVVAFLRSLPAPEPQAVISVTATELEPAVPVAVREEVLV